MMIVLTFTSLQSNPTGMDKFLDSDHLATNLNHINDIKLNNSRLRKKFYFQENGDTPTN